MAAYALIPLVSCIVGALSALVILLRDPGHAGNRLAALLIGGGAWWGACQLMWMVSDTPESALLFHKLAAPGWAYLGPLTLHLIYVATRLPGTRIPRLLPWLYGLSTAWIPIHFFSPAFYGSPEPAAWGWGFMAGPLLPVLVVVTLAMVIPAVVLGLIRVNQAPSPAERRQLRLISAGVAVPIVLITATGGVLPILGIATPRLGSASLAVLGVSIAWAATRYGFSALAPGRFSREIIETMREGLALVGLDGGILSANDQLARLLGISPAQLVGHPVTPDFSVDVMTIEALHETECLLTTASGERIPVGVSTSPLRDKRDLMIGTVLVVRDLREVVALRHHLVTSGRLAAVGELAAGIAHEINNPIAFVRANLAQLKSGWDALAAHVPPEHRAAGIEELIAEGHELIGESLEGIDRTSDIVKSVNGFAHGGTTEHEPVDLVELLRGVIRVAQPELRYHAEVVEELLVVPKVLGAAQELKQVFLNLIVNAGQAIEERGTVRVATHVRDDHVEVVVQDDGCGMPESVRERIFDPFFTTKPVGEGTGLGLAISYQILRNHEAEIAVESQPGVGTTFTVRFPCA